MKEADALVPENAPMAEALAKAVVCKEKGNAAFKMDDMALAKLSYEEGLRVLDVVDIKTKFLHHEDGKNLLISLLGNLAIVSIKQEMWSEAASSSSAVLELDKRNVKAYYRRGVAYVKLGRLDEARDDLSACIEIDPANAAAKKELAALRSILKDLQKREETALHASNFSKGIF